MKQKGLQADGVLLWASLFTLFQQPGRLSHYQESSPHLVDWYSTIGDLPATKMAVGSYHVQILPRFPQVSGNSHNGGSGARASDETEQAVKYLKEKVAFLESGVRGGPLLFFFFCFVSSFSFFHSNSIFLLFLIDAENIPAATGSTSEKDAKEIEHLRKENMKLSNRIRHLLKNYKADEEAAEKEKKMLRDNWRKAESRVGHLKRSLEAEEKLKK